MHGFSFYPLFLCMSDTLRESQAFMTSLKDREGVRSSSVRFGIRCNALSARRESCLVRLLALVLGVWLSNERGAQGLVITGGGSLKSRLLSREVSAVKEVFVTN